jgi:K+-transporting ATPase ATPase C chain
LLGLFTLITGVIYPLAVTAVAQALLPLQANGSLVTRNEIIIGSALIGQNWNEDPRYFWSRPSATNYSALPSGGSNLGATSATLRASVQQRAADFRLAHDVDAATALPADLLFASASGLDPHISPEAARLQAARVAAARGLPVITVSELVEQLTETPQFGFLGQPRVNVLLLNLALDELQLGQ